MIVLMLFVFGLCLGSFVNAYVWRQHMSGAGEENEKRKTKAQQRKNKQYSILKGRSMCVECEHELAAKDLVPLFSWLSLQGKCRYCHKSIAWQYPAVELLTALLFVLSYLVWPVDFDTQQWVLLGFWLAFLVGLVALAVYDLKWMLLPNTMLLPLVVISLLQLITLMVWQQDLEPLWSAFWGVVIGGGLFYVLFQVSDGKWIGGGDVKLGAVLGLFIGGPMQAILLLFFGSLIGTLVAVPLLATGKAQRTSKLPFGPFLIAAAFIVFLFGASILSWYNSLLII
jgi:prepilin signal peptidase PulO-like enzyme (type II secretory pathway)